jgi:diaminohydroxyphosphoribosylaminopyrimidine deaminase / 5-amino-6-(5-phosphoribosylamino)uracil reductase
MSAYSTEKQLLRQALDLAQRGIGLASPNPYVGAVIVDKQGAVAGTGTYTYESVKHAEVIALEQAAGRARGGTLYINLEPHAHHGRTPPCTDALIAAGIDRVVACMADPNPKVSGRGFEQLRAAGVRVEVGELEAEAKRLNEGFARYVQQGIPLVTLKSAMTIDGKIASPPAARGQATDGVPPGGWITGDLSRRHVQELRHENDAILAGIGTILSDDPLLTDRSGKPRRRPLLRVILDSHLRLPLESRFVRSAVSETSSCRDILVVCTFPDEHKKRDLESRGIRVQQLPPDTNGRPDLHAVLRYLGGLEITSLMVEGGSTINGAALNAGIVDKLFLYYAPTIMGTAAAVPFASGLHTRFQVRDPRLHRFGEDFAIEAYLRDPYLNEG